MASDVLDKLTLAEVYSAAPYNTSRTADNALGDSWKPDEAPDHWKAVPWLVDGSQHPYRGMHNDLDKLLATQAVDNTITWTWVTHAWRPLLMNWVYSLVAYGRVTSYIVVTLDAASLRMCLGLNLPCYNATWTDPALAARVPEDDYLHEGTELFGALTRWKPRIALMLMERGYHVHFSDPDAVWVKDAYRSLQRKLALFHADGTAMRELWPGNVVNVGHYLLRATSRSLALLRAMAADEPGKAGYPNDQAVMHSLRGQLWDVCYTGFNCTKIIEKGQAAINGHAEQVTGWWGQQCPNIHEWWPCPEHTLQLHFVCIKGGQGAKIKWMQHYNLWLVPNITTADAYREFRERGHEFLPCKDTLAWRYTTITTAYGDIW